MKQTKKIIKVCFQGETKRLRMADSYETLTKQSREAFAPLLDKMIPLKFYYIDEEQELISINCQSDFVEAVEFCDEILKLTVATNVQMARQQMVRNIDDNTSLAESLNQSQGFISQRSSYRMRSGTSDFEDLTKEQEASTTRVPFHKPLETKPVVHEIAVGSDNVHMKAVDMGTDVRNLIPKIDIATVTQNVILKDTNTNTCQEYSAASS